MPVEGYGENWLPDVFVLGSRDQTGHRLWGDWQILSTFGKVGKVNLSWRPGEVALGAGETPQQQAECSQEGWVWENKDKPERRGPQGHLQAICGAR